MIDSENITRQLNAYQERYPAESGCITRFKNFVKQYPNASDRSLEVGHLTASSWIVNATDGSFLLTHHPKFNAWLQLGGHIEGDLDLASAALREAYEESGLVALDLLDSGIFDLDIHSIPAQSTFPAHFHYDVRFLFRASGAQALTISSESIDLKWIAREEINSFTQEESILRMVRKCTLFNSSSLCR